MLTRRINSAQTSAELNVCREEWLALLNRKELTPTDQMLLMTVGDTLNFRIADFSATTTISITTLSVQTDKQVPFTGFSSHPPMKTESVSEPMTAQGNVLSATPSSPFSTQELTIEPAMPIFEPTAKSLFDSQPGITTSLQTELTTSPASTTPATFLFSRHGKMPQLTTVKAADTFAFETSTSASFAKPASTSRLVEQGEIIGSTLSSHESTLRAAN